MRYYGDAARGMWLCNECRTAISPKGLRELEENFEWVEIDGTEMPTCPAIGCNRLLWYTENLEAEYKE